MSDNYVLDASPSRGFDYLPTYSLHTKGVVGLSEQASPQKQSARKSECFNCGSTDHSLRDCPRPRNQAAIAQAREDFQASKSTSASGNLVFHRIHEVEERRSRLMSYLENFQPGRISDELREALEFSQGSTNFPWLYNMCEWGYPPGFEKYEDADEPYQVMLRRIRGPDPYKTWKTTANIEMEGLTVKEELIPKPPQTAPSEQPLPPTEKPPERKKVRYAFYETALFNSNLLPVCSPERLPPVDDSEPAPKAIAALSTPAFHSGLSKSKHSRTAVAVRSSEVVGQIAEAGSDMEMSD